MVRNYRFDEHIFLIKTNKHTIHVVIDAIRGTYQQLKADDFLSTMRSRI